MKYMILLFTFFSTLCFAKADYNRSDILSPQEQILNHLINAYMVNDFNEITEYQDLRYIGPGGGGGGPIEEKKYLSKEDWYLIHSKLIAGPNGGGGGPIKFIVIKSNNQNYFLLEEEQQYLSINEAVAIDLNDNEIYIK